jgi:hypothetical protein
VLACPRNDRAARGHAGAELGAGMDSTVELKDMIQPADGSRGPCSSARPRPAAAAAAFELIGVDQRKHRLARHAQHHDHEPAPGVREVVGILIIISPSST